jgi:hypothetical protein
MISRRGLLFAAGATIASSRAALASLKCRDYVPVRTCNVGLPVGLITAAQGCLGWCWAACIQTIFDYHGYSVEQGRIVKKLFGATACLPAIGPQIAYAIEGKWIDNFGDPFQARAHVLWDTQFGFGRPDAIAIAAQELAKNNPLILGAMGHATVMTAMTYSGNGQFVQINEVIVNDPWPGNPNRRALSPEEALAAEFLAAVRVS